MDNNTNLEDYAKKRIRIRTAMYAYVFAALVISIYQFLYIPSSWFSGIYTFLEFLLLPVFIALLIFYFSGISNEKYIKGKDIISNLNVPATVAVMIGCAAAIIIFCAAFMTPHTSTILLFNYIPAGIIVEILCLTRLIVLRKQKHQKAVDIYNNTSPYAAAAPPNTQFKDKSSSRASNTLGIISVIFGIFALAIMIPTVISSRASGGSSGAGMIGAIFGLPNCLFGTVISIIGLCTSKNKTAIGLNTVGLVASVLAFCSLFFA